MIITRECDYGVRIIRGLLSTEIQTVNDICKKEHVPVQYAYKILKKLERYGLVKSYRGPKGGYQLRKSPNDIKLFDIVAAIDGDLFVNACLRRGFSCPLNTSGEECDVHKELLRIKAGIIDLFSEKSMAEILG